MPFDPRTWIRRGAAYCGGMLACAVGLAPVPCAAQWYLRIHSQTSLKANCFEGCECYDNGVATACPVTHTRNYDSGPVFATHTFDDYAAFALGSGVAFDSSTRSNMSSNAIVNYGELRANISTNVYASGAYVETGGLAFSGDANVEVGVEFADDLTLRGAVPAGPVSIMLWQDISSTDLVLIRGSDNYQVGDHCLANGDATTRLDAVLSANQQSVEFSRQTNECSAPVVVGLRHDGIEIDGNDGDLVHI